MDSCYDDSEFLDQESALQAVSQPATVAAAAADCPDRRTSGYARPI